jgi:hypothetical protein
VRWKNNNSENEVQYIGKLGVNRLNLPLKSTDAVIIKERSIEIRLPWTLLHFVDPSEKKVVHDDRSTPAREDTVSEGIAIDFRYAGQVYSSPSRFVWEDWQYPGDVVEFKKRSYSVVQQGLENITSSPIAHADYYDLNEEKWNISSLEGLLANDVTLSKRTSEVYLYESPTNGLIQLNTNGSFEYQPIENFSGSDHFSYRLRSGPHWSEPVGVTLGVISPLKAQLSGPVITVAIYPNPASEVMYFKSEAQLQKVECFDSSGRSMITSNLNDSSGEIDIRHLTQGIYFVRFTTSERQLVYRFARK